MADWLVLPPLRHAHSRTAAQGWCDAGRCCLVISQAQCSPHAAIVHLHRVTAAIRHLASMVSLRLGLHAGMYKLSSFYISKSLTSLPFQSAFVFVYSVIIYFCAGLRRDAGAFLAFFALMLLQVQTHSSTASPANHVQQWRLGVCSSTSNNAHAGHMTGRGWVGE